MPTLPTLAAPAVPAVPDPDKLWNAVGTALLLTVIAVTLIVLAFWLKRQFFDDSNKRMTRPDLGGFSPSDLRRMRAEGKISEAEYERARAALVEPARRDAARAAGDDEREGDTRTKDTDLIRDAE